MTYMVDIQELVEYIDEAFDRPGGESRWFDELGQEHCTDVGYAFEWWQDCMKPELLRVFKKGE